MDTLSLYVIKMCVLLNAGFCALSAQHRHLSTSRHLTTTVQQDPHTTVW